MAQSPAKDQRPHGEDLLTIGTLAKACGVTVRTLRYYEGLDLIGPVKRSAGKYRLYNQRSLKRVKAILSLQDLNYSLEQILEMLGPYSESLQFSKSDRIQATRESLKTQKELLEGKLVVLKELKDGVAKRIQVLDHVCNPCHEKNPDENCHNDCEYRDIHLN